MRFRIRNFGLLLVMMFLFFVTVSAHSLTGRQTYKSTRAEHGHTKVTAGEYFCSGYFISSLSENIESEYFQMALFVYLTACLYQKGSAESKKPPFLWKIYENSLTLALTSLFLLFFLLHAYGSFLLKNDENREHGLEPISYSKIFTEQEFWFESFQKWQSEFFSVAAIVIFSIFHRQQGSSQSKRMFNLNSKTVSN